MVPHRHTGNTMTLQEPANCLAPAPHGLAPFESGASNGLCFRSSDLEPADFAPSVAAEAALPSRYAIVLVIDLVESVCRMQEDEGGVIQRWQLFSAFVNETVLPRHAGRLVKNLGDGMMFEFASAPEAVRAAVAMHEWMATRCKPLANGESLALRAGLHAARIFAAASDIYGIGVNLAARVCSLAEAGETIATSQLRDLLSDMLDAEIDDLGDCHLKHVDRPVRAFRLGPALHASSVRTERSYGSSLQASLAVIPFTNLLANDKFGGIGDLLADGIISALSPSPGLRVVSRLSTATFKARGAALATVAACLDVRYVVSGTYAISGAFVTIAAELADAAGGHILWSERMRVKWRDLLAPEGNLAHELADAIHRKLLATAASRAGARPFPALSSYELFLGGISMMHRASAEDFELSRRLLESLTERHRRVAAPHAWLGKWCILRTLQGATADLLGAASQALNHTQRALDLEPTSTFALAIEGFVHTHLRKDLATGEARLRHACAINPSESFAWLFLAVTNAFRGDSSDALEQGRKALALSPMDPLRYYYESLMGSCEFSAGNFQAAVRWCESSRRRNRQHLSTLRILIAAYAATGKTSEASAVAAEMMRLRPAYTVATYEANSVAVLYPFGKQVARAMRAAGVP
jgi:adenylate cyclase